MHNANAVIVDTTVPPSLHPTKSGHDNDGTLTTGYVDGIPPRRSTLQLVTLGAAVCGIEFCYAAETAFVSPALLKIGVPVAFMSLGSLF